MNTELRDPVGLDDESVPCPEYLCPRCGCPLVAVFQEAGSVLLCRANAMEHVYPVKNGVPVLIPPDLLVGTVETIETFAFKWEYAPKEMLEERRRIANEWFARRFFDGFSHVARRLRLDTMLAGKKRILDAGCGLGNLTTLFAQLAPDAAVYGVDLSTAVHHVEREPNMRLVQGDITRLPLAGGFDLIVSDGVLHHTPSTKGAFLSLAMRLAPGGDFLFYVYKVKAPVREFTDDHLRECISSMAPEAAMKVCASIADIGRQLREAGVTIHVKEPIPELGIASGDHELQRFVYWHFFKCFHDDGGDAVTSTLENFDWYHPRYAWRHTREEVERWVAEAGLKVVRCDDSESGYSFHVRRG